MQHACSTVFVTDFTLTSQMLVQFSIYLFVRILASYVTALGIPRFLLAFGNSSTQVCEAFKRFAARERLRSPIQEDRNLHYTTAVINQNLALSTLLIYSVLAFRIILRTNSNYFLNSTDRPSFVTVYCEVQTQTLNTRYMKCVIQRVNTVGVSNTFHNFPLCRISNT